ncbi:hypothetical protein ACODT5_00145 [Streptomyces sp. 5.8]
MVERTRTHTQLHSQPGFLAAPKAPTDRGFLLCGHRSSLTALIEEGGMS